jgi:hypothetical protein
MCVVAAFTASCAVSAFTSHCWLASDSSSVHVALTNQTGMPTPLSFGAPVSLFEWRTLIFDLRRTASGLL